MSSELIFVVACSNQDLTKTMGDRVEKEKMRQVLERLISEQSGFTRMSNEERLNEWKRNQFESFRKPLPDDNEIAEAKDILDIVPADQELRYEFLAKAFILSKVLCFFVSYSPFEPSLFVLFFLFCFLQASP